MATKTQVTESASSISGNLSVSNQDQTPPGHNEAATPVLTLSAGGVTLHLEDITISGWIGADPQPEAGHDLIFAAWIEVGEQSIYPHEFYYWDVSDPPFNISLDYSITVGARRIWRSQTLTNGVGRDATPVFADDVAYGDAWLTEPHPWSFSIQFGSMSYSGTTSYTDPPGIWTPVVASIAQLQISFLQYSGINGLEYASATLKWNGVDVNFSGRSRTQDGNPGIFTLLGSGNELTLTCSETSSGVDVNLGWAVSHTKPLIVDFTDFAVYNRKGTLFGELGILGPFEADLRYPWSLTDTLPVVEDAGIEAGTPIILSVNQIRSIGTWVQSAGIISGIDYTDPDYAHDLVNSAAMNFNVWEGY